MREGGRLGEGRAGPRAEGGLRAQMQAAWRGGGACRGRGGWGWGHPGKKNKQKRRGGGEGREGKERARDE